jgi:hypothetical protein
MYLSFPQVREHAMTQYSVTFYKHLVTSDGHPSKCSQGTIVIRRAKSIDRAVRAAEHRYERLCRLPDWTLHADSLELEVDGRKVDYRPTRDEITRHRDFRCIPGAHE